MNPVKRNQICEALLNILGEINEIEEIVGFDSWLDEQNAGYDEPDLNIVEDKEEDD